MVYVIYYMLFIIYYISYIIYHISYIIYHILFMIYHISYNVDSDSSCQHERFRIHFSLPEPFSQTVSDIVGCSVFRESSGGKLPA